MNKKIAVWLYPIFAVLLLIGLMPHLASAQASLQPPVCAEEYTIQADDWLSNISAKFLGEVTAYPAIAAITNQQHAVNATFAEITNPDVLEVGWKICIPTAESAQAWLSANAAAPALAGNLTVFAAASLTEAFTEIAADFEAVYPGVTVTLNFAGSQQLAQQLGQGAPVDVFASANTKQMQTAIEAGRVVADATEIFAHNRLVVIYPKDNPAQITQLTDLAKPGLLTILAAADVPVGKYSQELLDKAAQDAAFGPTFKEDVLKNVVSFEETVKAVFTKIALGEGDAGIVYSSDISQDNADKVGRLDIPDALNTLADYPIAPVSDSAVPALSRAFMDWVLSAQGQAVLAKYNFIPVEQTAASTGSGLTVTDALGRSVQFAVPPQRVVVAGKAIFMLADALYIFPSAIERVATLPSGGQSIGDFLSLVDPTFNQKTFLETDTGPEQIAAANPDVVVLKSYMAEKLGAPLAQLGIPVIYVDLETPEQYTRDLTTLGQLLGSPDRAEQILNFYQQRLNRVQQALAGLTDSDKPRVLLLQYSNKGGTVAFNVPPTGWIQTMLVDMAGGAPIWGESAVGGWTIVSFEQIAAWNPDQIFVINYFGDPQQVVDTLKADPQWQALSATANGQLYAFPKDFYSWDQPDPRWILGLQWLATKIQPERATGINIQQEIDQFYSQMYGLDQATIDAQVVPLIKGM